MRKLISRIRARRYLNDVWHLYMPLVLACFAGACCRRPLMEPLPPRYDNMSLSGLPLILAGQALENAESVEPPVTSRWNGRPVQLRKIRVKVEHIFSGQLNGMTLDIYYFTDLGSIVGSAVPITVKKGMSALFFLQADTNRWRSVCEDWSTCIIRVRTGTHYRYSAPTHRTHLEQDCVDFLMSRGENTTDEQMLDIIKAPPARWGWDRVLKRILQIAKKDPSPAVRLAAQKKAEALQTKYGAKVRAE